MAQQINGLPLQQQFSLLRDVHGTVQVIGGSRREKSIDRSSPIRQRYSIISKTNSITAPANGTGNLAGIALLPEMFSKIQGVLHQRGDNRAANPRWRTGGTRSHGFLRRPLIRRQILRINGCIGLLQIRSRQQRNISKGSAREIRRINMAQSLPVKR